MYHFSTDGKNESWNHCIYKQIKALDAALYPQRSPLQLCSLSLSLYVAKSTLKIWGRKSHIVWVSLIFPSNGGNSTAPQQSLIKTLFSPSMYCKPEGSQTQLCCTLRNQRSWNKDQVLPGQVLALWNLNQFRHNESSGVATPHPPYSPGKMMCIHSHWSSSSLCPHPSVNLL